MLIESSNDAAYAIGEVIGQEGFVELMNIYAQDIGLENTHFINLSGLESDDFQMNLSTSQDLVKLARYILKEHPEIKMYGVNVGCGDLKDKEIKKIALSLKNKEKIFVLGRGSGWAPTAGGVSRRS